MKAAYVFSTLVALSILQFSLAQPGNASMNSTDSVRENLSVRRINFYIVNKPKTLDLFSRMVIWRARLKSMHRRDKFIVIVAGSSKEAYEKINDYLEKKKAMIGSLWFDTHGHYANGYSSFRLGEDEFSFKTIRDTAKTKWIQELSAFCDGQTNIAIGSCYGGATFEKPEHNGIAATRMNGDSLMIGLADLLPDANIYGTEGWVMTKPGIFHKHSYALAGYPLQKRFKDKVYRPVWERMGIWHRYSTKSRKFETINTLSLTPDGSIHIKALSYLQKPKSKKKLASHLRKLRNGIVKT